MQHWSTITFLVTLFCLTSLNVFAQTESYLDENYKSANAENYTYKRVIKFKKHLVYLDPISKIPMPTDQHICTLTDYYKTGERAFEVEVLVWGYGTKCDGGDFHGPGIAYYKSGNIKWKAQYKAGKLHGLFTAYNEDGTERERKEYQNGNLIEANKFSVPPNSPLVGTWKYVEHFDRKPSSAVKRVVTVTYAPNSILEVTFQDNHSSTTEKRNWKYMPQSSAAGVLEEYEGGDMLERGTVRWINRNQFEYTIIFHQNANVVGQQLTFTRQ